jgi:hypothetical protein
MNMNDFSYLITLYPFKFQLLAVLYRILPVNEMEVYDGNNNYNLALTLMIIILYPYLIMYRKIMQNLLMDLWINNVVLSRSTYAHIMYDLPSQVLTFFHRYLVGIHVELCGEHVSAELKSTQFGECGRQNCIYSYSK